MNALLRVLWIVLGIAWALDGVMWYLVKYRIEDYGRLMFWADHFCRWLRGEPL